MARTVYYGYNPAGEFHIRVYDTDDQREQFVALTRVECQKIVKHIKFSKKGNERMIQTGTREDLPLERDFTEIAISINGDVVAKTSGPSPALGMLVGLVNELRRRKESAEVDRLVSSIPLG